MSPSVTKLDHVSVTVSDLERAVAFYRSALGLQEVERHRLEGEGISTMAGKSGVVLDVARMAAPGTPKILFDLQQYVQPPGKAAAIALGDVGHSHICFETEALADTCEALRRDGIELVSDPVTFQLESGELSVVFLKDPDGNIVELVQYPR